MTTGPDGPLPGRLKCIRVCKSQQDKLRLGDEDARRRWTKTRDSKGEKK